MGVPDSEDVGLRGIAVVLHGIGGWRRLGLCQFNLVKLLAQGCPLLAVVVVEDGYDLVPRWGGLGGGVAIEDLLLWRPLGLGNIERRTKLRGEFGLLLVHEANLIAS